MATKAKKKARKANAVVNQYLRPTEAREAHNDFQSAGMAMRVIPVIESMLLAGKLTRPQFNALDYYRDQAHRAEDDCAESSVLDAERIMGGGGGSCGGKIPARLLTTPALVETARLERDLGQLRDIARAVAVDDVTLDRWCIEKRGGMEVYRTVTAKDGKPTQEFVGIIPRDPQALAVALLELRYAAGMIAR
jgi:hypothetical protein